MLSIIALRRFYQVYNFTVNIVADILRYVISRLFIFCVLSIHSWEKFEKRLWVYAWSWEWMLKHLEIDASNKYQQLNDHYASRQYCMSNWRFKLIQFDYVEIFCLLKKKSMYLFTFQVDVSSCQFKNLLMKMISTNVRLNKSNSYIRSIMCSIISFTFIHLSHFAVHKFIAHSFFVLLLIILRLSNSFVCCSIIFYFNHRIAMSILNWNSRIKIDDLIFKIRNESLSNHVNSHDYVDKSLSIISKNVIALYVMIKHKINTTRNISSNQNRRLKVAFNKTIDKMKKRFVNIERQMSELQIKLNNDDARVRNKRICKMHERITFITTQISKRNDDSVYISHHHEFSKIMKELYALEQHAKEVFSYENWREEYWNETSELESRYYDNSSIASHSAIDVYFQIETVITLTLMWQIQSRLWLTSSYSLISWLNSTMRWSAKRRIDVLF